MPDGRSRVGLFGELELELDDRRLGPGDFGGVKPKQVLEILLLERGRAVAKDRIADLIWGERLPRNVPGTLETYVAQIRGALSADRGRAREILETVPGRYRFTADVDVDLDAFDACWRRAAAAPAAAERRARLEESVALAYADVLTDEPDADWAVAVRRQYAERRLEALVWLAETCLELSDPRAALVAADAALELDPAWERAHRAKLVSHYVLGEQEAALRAYETCRVALDRELGVAPLPETADLHLAVLQQVPPEDLLPPRAAASGPPPTRYADHDGVALAYQTLGSGPVDLLFMPGFISHLEASWENPSYGGFQRALATIARLIVFDKRGTGLSDPVVEWPSLEERADDTLAVLDACGSEQAVLFGISEAGPLSALFALRHPERVRGLVLFASFPRLLVTDEFPYGWTPEFLALFLGEFERAWGDGSGLEAINPSIAADPRQRAWWGRYARLSASPNATRRLMRSNAEIDIGTVLSDLGRFPVLIMARAGERWVNPEASRYLAERIPGARLALLDGVDHHPWVGDQGAVLAELKRFLAEH